MVQKGQNLDYVIFEWSHSKTKRKNILDLAKVKNWFKKLTFIPFDIIHFYWNTVSAPSLSSVNNQKLLFLPWDCDIKNTKKIIFSMKVEGGGHYLREVNDGAGTVFMNY